MKKAFSISIFLNILFILHIGYIIKQKGGINYLKTKINSQIETVSLQDSSIYFYHNTKKSIYEVMPNDTNEIIFLGNSITDYCDWHELFGKSNIKNRGISADTINGIVLRLDEIIESKPEKIFIMIGTNDLRQKRSINQILIDYDILISLIKVNTPKSKLYLQSILPTKNQLLRRNEDIIEINKGIDRIAKKYSFTYINLFNLFKTDNNELNMNYSIDGLHLNGQGYLIWKNEINKYVLE